MIVSLGPRFSNSGLWVICDLRRTPQGPTKVWEEHKILIKNGRYEVKTSAKVAPGLKH